MSVYQHWFERNVNWKGIESHKSSCALFPSLYESCFVSILNSLYSKHYTIQLKRYKEFILNLKYDVQCFMSFLVRQVYPKCCVLYIISIVKIFSQKSTIGTTGVIWIWVVVFCGTAWLIPRIRLSDPPFSCLSRLKACFKYFYFSRARFSFKQYSERFPEKIKMSFIFYAKGMVASHGEVLCRYIIREFWLHI